jgi:hypothetical protein
MSEERDRMREEESKYRKETEWGGKKVRRGIDRMREKES